MSLIEDIEKMRSSNLTEEDIMQSLKERGVSRQEIESALAQSQIKEAVMAQDFQEGQEYAQYQNQGEMQPSMLAPPPIESSQEQYSEYPQYQDSQEQYQEPSQQYEQYSYPQSSISADTITEISEQIIAEKLQNVRTQLEKTIDLKASFETKLSHIDERLQRIEKVIDRLQLSILQKVGDYISDVSDLKKELVETQKSFKSHKHK